MNFVEDCRETGEPVEAIVVERLDRLARDLMVSELLLAECRKRGLKVFSADQGALIDMASDGGDPTRVLIRQIMGALAQWEKSMLVKKLSSARNRVKAKTGRCEGKKPYGFYNAEKPVLKVMMDLSAVPGGTWRGVARQLNEAGLVTRAGGNWDSASVRRIVLVARKERGSNMRT
jgi:DNA invertase Pin-like site-specific DNA recombinase